MPPARRLPDLSPELLHLEIEQVDLRERRPLDLSGVQSINADSFPLARQALKVAWPKLAAHLDHLHVLPSVVTLKRARVLRVLDDLEL
eukprot:2403867-Pyramimonas_sp.AAC.1